MENMDEFAKRQEAYRTRSIWKFILKQETKQSIEMPVGAEILTAQMQGATTICMWAIVNPENDLQAREIYIRGTGDTLPLDVSLKYIATVQVYQFVFHIFERV